MVTKRDGDNLKKIGGLIIFAIFLIWFFIEALQLVGDAAGGKIGL